MGKLPNDDEQKVMHECGTDESEKIRTACEENRKNQVEKNQRQSRRRFDDIPMAYDLD